MKKFILGFIIGGIVLGTIGSVVAYNYNAKDIGYTPSDSNWNVNNVSDAINDLKDINSTSGYVAYFNGHSAMSTSQKELPLEYSNDFYATAANNSITIKKSGKYQIIATAVHPSNGNTTYVDVYRNSEKIISAWNNYYKYAQANSEIDLQQDDVINVKYYSDGSSSSITATGGTVVVIKK